MQRIFSTRFSIRPKAPVDDINFDLKNKDYYEVAKKIFDQWDPKGTGTVTLSNISLATGLNTNFIISLIRIIDSSSTGEVSIDELEVFINILVEGSSAEKLELLIRFADKDGSGSIKLEKVQQTIVEALFRKMISVEAASGVDFREVSIEDIKYLFENSAEGEDAIQFFCDRILEILIKKLQKRAPIARQNTTAVSTSYTNPYLEMLKRMSRPHKFIAALSIIQLALFLWVVIDLASVQKKPVSFAFAHGFGINLRIISLFQYATMARTVMAYFNKNMFLRQFTPLGFNIELHSFCGASLLLHSFGHFFAHIVVAEELIPTGFAYRFVQPCLINGSSFANHIPGDGITGMILLLLIVAFAITAMFRGYSSKRYITFIGLHNFHLIWPIFTWLHTPYNANYMIFIFILFVGERFFDFYYLTTFGNLSTCRPGKNGLTYISVKRIGNCAPGTYYRIKVPALSWWEWHPFSLAGGSTSENLTFFVAGAGDWTKRLHKLVSSPHRDKYSILVQGPFFAPASYAIHDKVMLAVASGVGITPFFSVMATHVNSEQVHEFDCNVFKDMFQEDMPPETERSRNVENILWREVKRLYKNVVGESKTVPRGKAKIHVVWSLREVNEMLFYFDYIRNLLKLQDAMMDHKVEVDVFLTGIGSSTDPTQMLSQTLFLLSLSDRNHRFMRIHFGRPDLDKIIKSTNPKECYYCGGVALKDALRDSCYNNNVRFYAEDFDSGGVVINAITEWMKPKPKPVHYHVAPPATATAARRKSSRPKIPDAQRGVEGSQLLAPSPPPAPGKMGAATSRETAANNNKKEGGGGRPSKTLSIILPPPPPKPPKVKSKFATVTTGQHDPLPANTNTNTNTNAAITTTTTSTSLSSPPSQVASLEASESYDSRNNNNNSNNSKHSTSTTQDPYKLTSSSTTQDIEFPNSILPLPTYRTPLVIENV